MKYRKQKKILKKELVAALKHFEEHFMSNSALGRYRVALFELQELKRNKKRG